MNFPNALLDLSGDMSGSSEAALPVLVGLCRFLLVSCAAYGLCWFLARLATSAAYRFTIWLLYIVSVAGYWVAGLVLVFRALPVVIAAPRLVPAPGSHPDLQPVLSFTLSGALASSIGSHLPLVFESYLAVLAGLALLGIFRRRQLARALRFRLAPSAAMTRIFDALAAEIGVPRCRLWLMPGITTPAAIYWLHPAVCLPAACTEDTFDLENILRHELCHIHRRDNLWETVARSCRSLLFFHPLLYQAFTLLRFEREVACDMEVVRSHPDKRDRYADTLVRFGWMTMKAGRSHSRFMDVRFAAQAGVLNARVRSILAGERFYSRWSQRRRTLFSVAGMWVFAAAVPACWVRIHLTQPTPPVEVATSISARPQPRAHRTIRLATFESVTQSEAPTLSAVATTSPSLLPELTPASLPEVRYQSQHAGQLLSTTHEVEEPQDDGGTVLQEQKFPSGANHKLPPAAVPIIVGAAVALGRLGLSHDHDHN